MQKPKGYRPEGKHRLMNTSFAVTSSWKWREKSRFPCAKKGRFHNLSDCQNDSKASDPTE